MPSLCNLWPRMVYLVGVAALAGTAGCAHFQGEPRPLYAGPVLPPSQTALLSGYVAKVDDLNVAHLAGPFSLLPGCHIVVTRNNVGDDSPSGAWSVVMAQLTFALRMQAGRAYEIQIQRQGGGSETANLKMRALEFDGSGNKLQELPPSYGKAAIEACRAWAAEQESNPQPAAPQEPVAAPSIEPGPAPAPPPKQEGAQPSPEQAPAVPPPTDPSGETSQ